ncbi:MAG: SDR family oxidoreductase [Burkholderiaceae bacterium]
MSAAPRRAVFGDLTSRKLGVSAEDVKKLKGQIDHFHHLAAVYDLSADAEPGGREHRGDAQHGGVHKGHRRRALSPHVSSIAAAGRHEGVFREDLCSKKAEGLDHRTS